MNYDAVPQLLKEQTQWVTWRFETDPKHPEKPKKVPYNPYTGKRADTTNPSTWGGFDVAVKAATSRRHAGVGFVFSPSDPFVGIDLDDCRDDDGNMEMWAVEIVNEMMSYTEVSPSGHGVKLIIEGTLPEEVRSVKTTHVEIYDRGRYFTITGQHLAGTPTTIRNVNGALADLCARVRPEPEPGVSDAGPMLSINTALDQEYLRVWAERLIDQACSMLALEPDGNLHNKRLDMGRWVGGLIPLGLATEDELERRLYNARIPKSHHADERKVIRDGIGLGAQKPLPLPDPPPQPLLDGEGIAHCPIHKIRLPQAKNGNGYKCHERDTTTASGWCDFWWKGTGYIEPSKPATDEPIIIAGELISAAPSHSEAAAMSIPRYVLYNLGGLRALPPVSWLIDGEVPAGLTTVICGPSGAGKSFLAVDYALQVARRYPDRAVVYIAPEGGSGYHMRADAWLAHHGGEEPTNILFVLQAIPILNPQAVNDLIAAIRPLNPILLVIDTLARCLVGGDENSAKDVGVFFYHTDLIRQETGAAIAIIHHTGKSGASYRGSSALYGAADSWIDVANDDGLITVSCGKAKDWTPFAPRYLRMVESVQSVVLVPSDQVAQRGGGLTEGQRKILETLALDIFTGPGAKRSELVGATGITEVTIYRILSRLKRDGYISQSKKGDPYYITSEGMTAIRNYHRALRRSRSSDMIVDPQQDAQLSQLSSNYQPTIKSDSHQLSNYHPTPFRGVGDSSVESDSSASDSSSEDLFPEDEPPSVQVADPDPLAAIPKHLRMTTRMMLCSDLPANQETARHRCELYGIDADAARAALREWNRQEHQP